MRTKHVSIRIFRGEVSRSKAEKNRYDSCINIPPSIHVFYTYCIYSLLLRAAMSSEYSSVVPIVHPSPDTYSIFFDFLTLSLWIRCKTFTVIFTIWFWSSMLERLFRVSFSIIKVNAYPWIFLKYRFKNCLFNDIDPSDLKGMIIGRSDKR